MLNVCYDRSGGQPCKNVLAAGIFAAYCKSPSDYLTLEFTKSGYISGFKKPLLPQCKLPLLSCLPYLLKTVSLGLNI